MITLFEKFGFHSGRYPRQFWLLFWGMLLSTIGTSMAWPFLVVYVSGKLNLPLLAVTGLITLSSIMSLVSSVIGGPIIDRMGRKWVMVVSLFINGLGYFLLGRAETYPAFAAIMILNGIVNPLYRIGADTMMADLIPAEQRADAYSLMRMSNNLGISVGPAVGGFLIAISYSLAFSAAAIGLAFYGILVAVFAAETLPGGKVSAAGSDEPRPKERFGGYGQVLANRPFTGMVVAFALVTVCASLMWVLMAVYAKTNYGVEESRYGWIPTTNALMVVLFQFLVTQVSKRYRPMKVLALGAFFYAISNLCVAISTGFWGFWSSMVVMTVGELILVPTSSTYAANLAPPDQRARYMSLYSLTWSLASAGGPVFGGLISDLIHPRAVWFGGSLVGLCSLAGFLYLDLLAQRRTILPSSQA